MKDTFAAIRERSSTRGYTEQKLTEEEIKALIDAALASPTATNRQEIHVSVLDGENEILSEIEREKNALAGIGDVPHNFYYEASSVFILSGEEAFGWSSVDAGIAVQSMALAAEAMGLGSLIIGCVKKALTGDKKEYFAKKLRFPEGYGFEIAIAVGHKGTEKAPHEYDSEKSVSVI